MMKCNGQFANLYWYTISINRCSSYRINMYIDIDNQHTKYIEEGMRVVLPSFQISPQDPVRSTKRKLGELRGQYRRS